MVLTQQVASVNGSTATLAWSYQGNDDSWFEVEMEDETQGENFHLIETVGTAGSNGEFTLTYAIPGDDTCEFRMPWITPTERSRITRTRSCSLHSWMVRQGSTATPNPVNPATGFGDIHLAWTAEVGGSEPTDISGYILQYHSTATPGPGWLQYFPGSDSGYFSVGDSSADVGFGGVTYWFRMAALHNDGSSSNWSEATATSLGPTTTVTPELTVVGSDEIDVSLNPTSNDLWAYDLYKGTVSTDGKAIVEGGFIGGDRRLDAAVPRLDAGRALLFHADGRPGVWR